MQYLLILYQGLRQEIFYWEFINTFRKSIILLIFIALSFLNQSMKIILSAIVLYSIIRLEMKVSPYREKDNNFLEIRAMIASLITMIAGLVFVQDVHVGYIDTIILLFVIVINLWFLVEWVYMLSLCMQSKYKAFAYMTIIMKIITFREWSWLINFTTEKNDTHISTKKSEKTKPKGKFKIKWRFQKKMRNRKRLSDRKQIKKESSEQSIDEVLKIDISENQK